MAASSHSLPQKRNRASPGEAYAKHDRDGCGEGGDLKREFDWEPIDGSNSGQHSAFSSQRSALVVSYWSLSTHTLFGWITRELQNRIASGLHAHRQILETQRTDGKLRAAECDPGYTASDQSVRGQTNPREWIGLAGVSPMNGRQLPHGDPVLAAGFRHSAVSFEQVASRYGPGRHKLSTVELQR